MATLMTPIRTEAERQGADCNSYRLLILSSSGTKIFLANHDGNWALPAVNVPPFSRVVDEINQLVRKSWNITTTLLFLAVSGTQSQELSHAVLEAPNECSVLPGFAICDVSEALSRLHGSEGARLLTSTLARLADTNGQARRAPFGTLGWIYTLLEWVKQASGSDNIQSFSQLSGSDDTALIRFHTSSTELWYKAVGESDPRELRITSDLWSRVPQYLPRIVAFDPERKAWLMESGGEPLRERGDHESWRAVARQLAAMEMDSVDHAADILRAGCIDLRVSTLKSLIRPFFEFISDLMKLQVKNPPSPLTGSELEIIAHTVSAALSSIESLGLPEVIGHGDFNPGNVLLRPNQIVFIDWSAAFVGSPALTLEYLLSHFERNCNVNPEQKASMRNAYAEQWLSSVPKLKLERLMDASPLIAVYASAIADDTWRNPERLAYPGAAGYLRSLARIMKREAESFSRRRLHA